VVLDVFSKSSPEALRRVLKLAGLHPGDPRLPTITGDIRSNDDLERAFQAAPQPIEAVVHFACLKAVGESVLDPLRYWDVNLAGSRCLLTAMQLHGCRTLVFSSSATLYGLPDQVPIAETAPVQPINPYGHTKAAVEQLLADLAGSEPGWSIARLRYFNPVGAHPSGRIGEEPLGPPNNLFPFISQVAVGRRTELQVFGNDWPTADGSGVRDYIHVMDLSEGHRAALDTLLAEPPQLLTLNLGSGVGHSVLELVKAFEADRGRPVTLSGVARRPGDAACTVTNAQLAHQRLG